MAMPRFLIAMVFAAVLAAGGGIVAWQLRINANQAKALATSAAENRELRARLQAPARGNSLASIPPPMPPAARQIPPVHPPVRPSDESGHEVAQLRASLAEAKAAAARLETQISDLEGRIKQAKQENGKLSAAVEGWQDKLADAARVAEHALGDLKASQERVAQLEAANARLRQASAAVAPQNPQAAQYASQLQEISRRRDVYLNSIIRRYRELTDQYRAMTGVLDGRRDREASPVSGLELSRIQSTIAMAEEDLRQIDSLNAQALRIERKLK